MRTELPAALAASSANFADIDVSTAVWIGFVALLAGLLAVDLAVHRGNHVPTARRALVESGAWVACGDPICLTLSPSHAPCGAKLRHDDGNAICPGYWERLLGVPFSDDCVRK